MDRRELLRQWQERKRSQPHHQQLPYVTLTEKTTTASKPLKPNTSNNIVSQNPTKRPSSAATTTKISLKQPSTMKKDVITQMKSSSSSLLKTPPMSNFGLVSVNANPPLKKASSIKKATTASSTIATKAANKRTSSHEPISVPVAGGHNNTNPNVVTNKHINQESKSKNVTLKESNPKKQSTCVSSSTQTEPLERLVNDRDIMESFNYSNMLNYLSSLPMTITVKRTIPAIPIDLFTPADALNAAQNGQKELAQTIFKIVLLSKYPVDEKPRLILGINTSKRTIKQYDQDVSVWTTWAWYEEQWGNIDNVVEIFEVAESKLMVDLDRLQTEFKLFLMRFYDDAGKNNNNENDHKQLEETSSLDASPMAPVLEYTFLSSGLDTISEEEEEGMELSKYRDILHNDDCSSDDSDLENEYNIKDINAYLEAKDGLEKIYKYNENESINFSNDVTPRPNKISSSPYSGSRIPKRATPFSSKLRETLFFQENEDDNDHGYPSPSKMMENKENNGLYLINKMNALSIGTTQPIKSALACQKKKKTTSVRFDIDENGARAVFLTPVRAKKDLKEELGVDTVVTPVRRSLRIHEKQEEQFDLDGLLEKHGFAFVPNKSVETPKQMRR